MARTISAYLSRFLKILAENDYSVGKTGVGLAGQEPKLYGI